MLQLSEFEPEVLYAFPFRMNIQEPTSIINMIF